MTEQGFPRRPRVVLLTGMSGSGKSTVMRALEDLGFFCVDNLPTRLMGPFLDVLAEPAEAEKVALVADLRDSAFAENVEGVLKHARDLGYRLEVVFLEASTESILDRFSETRRPHPLDATGDLGEAIQRERKLLEEVRARADLVIDTTGWNVHQLRDRALREFASPGAEAGSLTVRVVSFGFRYGAPHDADLVMDVRFLPNPHFVPGLREKTGKDPRVAAKVLDSDEGRTFMQRFGDLLEFLLPRYRNEGKSYLTIAIGCTGGKHRSVAVAEAVSGLLGDLGNKVNTVHRDISRA